MTTWPITESPFAIPRYLPTRHEGAARDCPLPSRRDVRDAQEWSLPALPPATLKPYQSRHWLLTRPGTSPAHVEIAAASRFASARWDSETTLKLTRHTTITGPWALPSSLPGADLVALYDVVCPRERWEDPPDLTHPDRDGLASAFPDGLPCREEDRVVMWLIATARRLGGDVLLDVAASRSSHLTPDPYVSPGLTVYSPVWLEPDAGLAVVQGTVPDAALVLRADPAGTPPPLDPDLVAAATAALTDDLREALMRQSAEMDAEAQGQAHLLDGYAIHLTAPTAATGVVSIEVGGDDALPGSVRGMRWAENGCVTYRLRWDPPDLADAHRPTPSSQHLTARSHVAHLIAQAAHALWTATGGLIADDDGFLVEPSDLADP